jgi:hypothetical protein
MIIYRTEDHDEHSTMQDLKILNLEVDDDGGESYFRVLVNSKDVKYITIDFGIYDTEDMTWDVALIPSYGGTGFSTR